MNICPTNSTAHTSPRHILGAPISQTQCGDGHSELTLAQRTAANSPFAILYQPRATPKPFVKKKNRGPIRTKEEWAVISLETPAQRKERQIAERNKAMAEILRKNKYSEVGLSTRGAADRAAQIRTNGVC